ncbi:Hydroxyquinol 1,2-dioxygenase [Cedecea neteri]|uniref:Hydroxyquinol 1,2-dioxygenase n=1 Tax=Cedecea neteri TaxID=158822 RepID=A0A291E0F6_9ENTR|nr:dioxygenase [Cedecea neteri]ATF93555.1 hydroxyquinol 1,2-dioxygenase [Cedecea neteri]SQA96560.1 Hydroxyquinol 1,2-dioxygenase [Cedecea neteri]
MLNIDDKNITQEVLSNISIPTDDRMHTIFTGLIEHLHSFAREVQLTEQEWEKGIEFLTQVGKYCSPERQEFILLSDVLGLSSLVIAQNNRKPVGCTESTVFGPFHVAEAPLLAAGEDFSQGAPGTPWFVKGKVIGISGEAVANATIDIWHADGDGQYDVQASDVHGLRCRGVMKADSQGEFFFRTVVPEAYEIPSDGPVGSLLAAQGRGAWRPAHLHFMINAEGYQRLITHIFNKDDDRLNSDSVFGVRTSLIADWIKHAPGIAPDGTFCQQSFCTLDFNFVLNPVN